MKNRAFLVFLLIALIISTEIFPQSETVLSKDGSRISYSKFGKGEPALVFVHGWSCDKSYWSNQEEIFAENYTVVTIDLAGHGKSGTERNNYTMELFGQDVAAVVNSLDSKKTVLIGHSMGGVVIIEAARILKDKIIGLVGADTFQNLGETMPAEQVGVFMKPFKENFSASTREFVKSMFPPNADPALVKKVSDDMASAPEKVAVSAMENMFKGNAIEALGEIDIPIISINCDRYPIRVEENRKMTKSYELKMMNGVGHFVMLEDPARFNLLLQEAIDGLTEKN
ncbi:MAG: alpha/beta hydrolase [Melioribacteraceae bacterium]